MVLNFVHEQPNSQRNNHELRNVLVQRYVFYPPTARWSHGLDSDQNAKDRSASTIFCMTIGATPFLLFMLFAQALPPIEATPDVIRPIFRVAAVGFGVVAFTGGIVVGAVVSHILYVHSQAKLGRTYIPD